MIKKSDLIISLTGGLGNQLFQLAAGLAIAKEKNLYLCSSLGAPRTSANGDIELLSFSIPYEIKVIQEKPSSLLTRKVAGYILRIGVSPNRFESYEYFSRILRSIAALPLSFFLRRKVSVVNSVGVGYHPIFLKKKVTLLFGYFQTYRWTSDRQVKQIMQKISLRDKSIEISEYMELSFQENPIIVHVRLGDYLSEKNFGIPSKNYYKEGITRILESGKCKSIWLFSDQLQLAKTFLPDDLNIPIRVIDKFQQSPAATLEIMRMGAGYVIANSTFSWWAAFLRKNEKAEVIAPKPWFSGMPEPVDLIPISWQRINSGFASNY
jgi:hypothetical protein